MGTPVSRMGPDRVGPTPRRSVSPSPWSRSCLVATVLRSKAPTLAPEERFVLRAVGWNGYETMLRLVGDRLPRMTYDRGDLELMSPSYDHDLFRTLLGRFIEILTEELDIPCQSLG